jgi:hypothetical protein
VETCVAIQRFVGSKTEGGRRRRAALALVSTPLFVTILHLAFYRDMSWGFEIAMWIVGGSLSLYMLWLSTPRFGSARFEAAATKNAITFIPVAFLAGIFITMLFYV